MHGDGQVRASEWELLKILFCGDQDINLNFEMLQNNDEISKVNVVNDGAIIYTYVIKAGDGVTYGDVYIENSCFVTVWVELSLFPHRMQRTEIERWRGIERDRDYTQCTRWQFSG